jgi:hypothetical protein
MEDYIQPIKIEMTSRQVADMNAKMRRERLAHERPVIAVSSKRGTVSVGEYALNFAMSQEKVHRLLGRPDRSRNNLGSFNHVDEVYFERGFTLRYAGLEQPYSGCGDALLSEIIVMEKNGWRVEVDGVPVFDDAGLAEMKTKYKHTESRSRRATAFPALGLFTVGCGGKPCSGTGAKGKMAAICSNEVMRSYISTIAMWDR